MSQEDGSPAWQALRAKSAEELLRDFICPVAREFWVPRKAPTEENEDESAPIPAAVEPPAPRTPSWRAQKKRLQQRAARERHRRERSLWQCKAWKESPGSCRWGDDCLFAHGDRPGKLTRKGQQQEVEEVAKNDDGEDTTAATPLPDLADERCPVDAIWPGSCEFERRGTCCWGVHGGENDEDENNDNDNDLDLLFSLRRRKDLLPGSASTNALTPQTRDALFSGSYDFTPSIAVLDSLGLSHGVAGDFAAKARARTRARARRKKKKEEEGMAGGAKESGGGEEQEAGAGTGERGSKEGEDEGEAGTEEGDVGGDKGGEAAEGKSDANVDGEGEQKQQRQLNASISDDEDEDSCTVFYRDTRPTRRELQPLDLRGKLYLAPLTTVGNLPFRALAVSLGADVTCSEMALATNLLRGHKQEWALLKRHESEKVFGVQIAGGHADAVARATQLIWDATDCRFVDLNLGCPIDLVAHKGAGAGLLARPKKVEALVKAMAGVAERCSENNEPLFPITVKVRKGVRDGADSVHSWLPTLARGEWGRAVSAVTIHGRSKQQRYSRDSDWGYVGDCAKLCSEANPRFQVVSSGDVATWQEYERLRSLQREVDGVMLARGALVKPWLFTEIKEQRDIDLRSSERLELYKRFCSLGLSHWGSDPKGVETTRRFFLEWMGFAHRYVPVGLIEEDALKRDAERAAKAAAVAAAAAAAASATADTSNWSTTTLSARRMLRLRAPRYRGRDDLETLLASEDPRDWVRVSEMALGGAKAPPGYRFEPKHKSNAYSASAALDGDE